MRSLLAVLTFSVVASASTFTFQTPTGSTTGGQAVSATASVTTNANGTVTVVLNDNLASTLDAAQLLSDFFFKLSVTPTTVLTGTTVPTIASLINISSTGVVTSSATALAGWGLSSSGATVHLDSLVGGGSQTIIGPGPYTAANGSIDGNAGHNPFINQTATFNFAVGGVNAGTTVSGAVFSFGTVSGNNVTGIPSIPEPITSGLVGTGLISLFFLRRRSTRKA